MISGVGQQYGRDIYRICQKLFPLISSPPCGGLIITHKFISCGYYEIISSPLGG